MQQIVDYVAGYKASPFFYRSIGFECELGCKIEVAEQTYDIAYRIGNVDVNCKFKQQVDSVMDDRSYASYNCKSDELYSNELIPKISNSAVLHLCVCKGLSLQCRFHLLLQLLRNFLSRILNNHQIYHLYDLRQSI